jgi:hypothetical protein
MTVVEFAVTHVQAANTASPKTTVAVIAAIAVNQIGIKNGLC